MKYKTPLFFAILLRRVRIGVAITVNCQWAAKDHHTQKPFQWKRNISR
jgi:hypothetical protein